MKKQSGFTLIELMVVMAIIAILATAGLSAYTNYIKTARDTARLVIAKQLGVAVESISATGAPTPQQLADFLNSSGFAWELPTMNPVIARASGIIDNAFGTTFAVVKDPGGGYPSCLNTSNQPTALCGFIYMPFADGTYLIGYGVESVAKKLTGDFHPIQGEDAPGGGSPITLYVNIIGSNGPVLNNNTTDSINNIVENTLGNTNPFSATPAVMSVITVAPSSS